MGKIEKSEVLEFTTKRDFCQPACSKSTNLWLLWVLDQILQGNHFMKAFIKLAMVALSISTIGCRNENIDSRAIGNQLIEVDKVLAVWEGHQARSVYAVKNFVKDDMFLSGIHDSTGFKTLQFQKNLLQEINGLEKEIRDQSLMDWGKVQTEALNLLRSSRGALPENNLSDSLEILSKQERELKLLYDKRKKLVDTLVQDSK